MDDFKRLRANFFARDTRVVAQEMIGKWLVQSEGTNQPLIGRIVETEAYIGNDPACHAYSNWKRQQAGEEISGRSVILFGDPGIAYVYLNYGMYWLFNVVTETRGVPGAVLVRGIEPIQGIEVMRRRRPKVRRDANLTNGPGKLTRALKIDRTHNERDLQQGGLFIAAPPAQAVKSRRLTPLLGLESPKVGNFLGAFSSGEILMFRPPKCDRTGALGDMYAIEFVTELPKALHQRPGL